MLLRALEGASFDDLPATRSYDLSNATWGKKWNRRARADFCATKQPSWLLIFEILAAAYGEWSRRCVAVQVVRIADQGRTLMTSKRCHYLLLTAVLSLIGMSACATSPEPESDPVSNTAELASEISESSAESTASYSMCCIDYYCPANGFEATGCKVAGGPTPGVAFRECTAACGGTYCESSGWYCL
jgi:hypothetical protein